MSDRLFALLPAVHRQRDHAQGSPLRALLSVLGDEVDRLEDDIAGLYDNWFIETCDEWVVPYIGDLLGVRPLAPLRDGAFSQRGYVANTLAYRRRKGTASVLEQLSRDLTGWPARAVEFFERLATTQHVNHPRLHATTTADVRDAARLQHVGTPFETASHMADMRHIDNGRGRYNVPNVGLFVFRLQGHLLADVTARRIDGTRYHLDPLGLDSPLFSVPADAASGSGPKRHTVAMPISRRALHDELAHYYGTDEDVGSLRLSVGGLIQPVELVDVCDLSDAGGGLWAHAARPGRIAIDPVSGRLAFGAPPAGEVTASLAHGCGGDLGGGPYDRRGSLTSLSGEAVTWQAGVTRDPPAGEPRVTATLVDAVTAWNEQPAGTNGLIVLMDNRTCEEDLDTGATRIKVPAGSRLVIAAAQWPEEETGDPLRPLARLTGRLVPSGVRAHLRGRIEVEGTGPSTSATAGQLVLNGLMIEGRLAVLDGDLGELRLDHCTLAPHASTFECGANPRLRVGLSRSIAGDLAVRGRAADLHLADTIVDGAVDADALQVERTTVFGTIRCRTLVASDSIFVDDVTVERRQVGCVRFCALPFASHTPRRYRCQPASAAEAAIAPVFSSTRYGDPGYGMLAPGCPAQVAEGAEGEGEIGAWNFLQAPVRLRNLRAALDEYLRFGLEAGVVVASQQL